MFVHYENGVITAAFRNPQPDAVDDNGVVLCPGVSTVELPDNHPDVVAYLSSANSVPAQATMAQTRLALLQAGLLSQVQNAIAAASQAVQIEWEYRDAVRRNSQLVLSLTSQLGWTKEQVDDLFRLAVTL